MTRLDPGAAPGAQEAGAKPALVTGAGGFIGGYLVDHLIETGAAVRGLVRSAAAARALESRGVSAVVGDLRHPTTLAAAVAGCGTVYHCAAWMGEPLSWEAAFETNVLGTRNLAEACLRGNVARLVHVSSIAVYGPTTADPISELTPLWPLGPYRGSKIAAGRGLETVIVRPGQVYGPGDRRLAGWALRWLRRGIPLIVDTGDGFCHPVYVRNLADAVAGAGAAATARGGVFNVADGDVTWREFLGCYARMVGRPLRSAPSWAVRAAAAGSEALARLTRSPARLPRAELAYLVGRSHFSAARARSVLGWTPRVPFELAMRETEAWLRRTGLLDRAAGL